MSRIDMNINELARTLAAQRGQDLEIRTRKDGTRDHEGTCPAIATINGQEARYWYTREPERPIERMLRSWPGRVRIDGRAMATNAPARTMTNPETTVGDAPDDHIVIRRADLPLAGYHGQAEREQTLGKSQPIITALGLEFGVPHRPGLNDWREQHLSAPDPDATWEHLRLNIAATVTPAIALSDEAAVQCRFLSDDDQPYIMLSNAAMTEAAEQMEQAAERAKRRLEILTGATGFARAQTADLAAGSHEAYGSFRSVRCTPAGGTTVATIAQNAAGTNEQSSAARALYRTAQEAIVPLAGHYGAGAHHNIRIIGWDVTERNGAITRVAPGQTAGRSRLVAGVALNLEVRPFDEDEEPRQIRVQTDLLVTGHEQSISALVAPPLDEQHPELVRLLADMAEVHRHYGGPHGEDPEDTARITALIALGHEDEAFRIELQQAADRLEQTRRAQPASNEIAVDSGDATLWWQRR